MASSKTALYAAIAGNTAISVAKFVAAAHTGSAAMLAEGVHSLVHATNGCLLVLGVRKIQKSADENNPYGFGKELYFFVLIAGIMIFAVGGGVSIYHGAAHMFASLDGAEYASRSPLLSYIVLGLALAFQGIAWATALKGFLAAKGEAHVWRAIRTSKDPTTFAVLLEGAASLAGLVAAAAGIYLAHRYQQPWIEGAASIVIGLILCAVAFSLVLTSKRLLGGDRTRPKVVERIRELATADDAIVDVGRVMTTHMAPREILLNIELQFRPGIEAGRIETAVDRLDAALRRDDPRIQRIFIEAESIGRAARAAEFARVATDAPSTVDADPPAAKDEAIDLEPDSTHGSDAADASSDSAPAPADDSSDGDEQGESTSRS